MKLSIVIVSWNTVELLRACLQTVAAQVATIASETFVVDNDSKDGSQAMVAADFPWVTLICNEDNPGFAAANNQAIGFSQGAYVLLLNPDTVLRPQALARLLAFAEAHPEAGVVGAKLLNEDGSLQPSCYIAPTPARELWRLLQLDRIYPWAVYRMAGWSQTEPRAVDIVQGACFLIRRAAAEAVGWLDERYFIYMEDFDLCYRMRQAGWSVFWVPQAEVVHYGGQSTQQVALPMFLRLYQTKLQYMRAHYGRGGGWRYKGVLGMVSLLRLAPRPFLFLWPADKRSRLATVGHHYFELLKQLPAM